MTEMIVDNHPKNDFEKNDEENICEICFGNCKCDKYKCKECDNSICIECAENWSKMDASNKGINYIVKCPFCRETNVYNYDDLTNEEYKVFYINLRKRLGILKKPLWEQQKICEKYCDDLLYVKYWVKRMNEDTKLRCDKKFYESIANDISIIAKNKYEVLYCDKIHRDYEKAIEEIENLKDNKRLYDSCKAYNDTIRNKLVKQQSELQKQTEMMRNMEKQNELLLRQNRELFNKVNDIYNIVKNKNDIRKPQQVIKTIENNIKDVVDKIYHLNINIVLNDGRKMI